MNAGADTKPTVGVVGASARAAVHSLLRAGYKAWAVDLFGDRDLARVAPCAVCPFAEYPDTLPQLAAQFPPGPVLYTGGLENHPQVVAELASSRELWGDPPPVLELVRDPYHLTTVFASAGFRVPALVPRGSPCPTAGRWLRKPIRSSAGLGIRFAHPGEPPSPDHVFQEFIDGVPMSAVYRGTTMLGVSEQLVGEPWLHAKPFHYCGSIRSESVPTDVFGKRVHIFADFLFARLWNIDFILTDGEAVPIELNPRYSASVEVLEHSHRVAACGIPWAHSATPGTVGKAIYNAPHDITFPQSGPWEADLTGEFDPWKLPAFADIPAPGAVIPAGFPILTILVSGSSPTGCRERLQSRARELDQLLAEGQR